MNENFNLTDDVKKFLDELTLEGGKPVFEMTPTEARKFLNTIQQKYSQPQDADTEDRTILTDSGGEVDVRIFRPKENRQKLPAIIYSHGGGWVMGDKDDFDSLMKRLSAKAQATVIFVNYSRSPEAKYPKALNEIYGVMEYVYYNPDEFNIDKDKIVVAGDSAGANMTAAALVRAKLAQSPKISGQILFYPVCDTSMNSKSYNVFKNGPWLSKKAMEYFFDAYLSSEKLKGDKFVSILKMEEKDLENLPPTLLITDENDVLRDEGEEFAKKLEQAGVKVQNFRSGGTIHDFMLLNALQDSAQVKAVFALVTEFLQTIFDDKKPE